MSRRAVGVDIGGSGIKGAPVDLDKGEFAAERVRIPGGVGGDDRRLVHPSRLTGEALQRAGDRHGGDDLAGGGAHRR